MKRTVLLSVAALAIVVAACSPAATTSSDPATPAPSPAESMPPEPATPAPSPAAGTIVEVASEAGSFTTLLAAAEAAGLVETLSGEGPYTVFAPTDDAFAALPEGTLDSLLADPEALKAILLYHVVPGTVTSAQVVELTEATSAEGSPIAIAVENGTVVLNDTAKVVTVDIPASNGVIHVIDAVILPPTD